MAPRPVPVLIVLSLLAAGCLSPAGDEEEGPDPVPDERIEWTWETAAPPSMARGEAACAGDGAGRILLAGGLADVPVSLPFIFGVTASVEVYDAENDTWSHAPDLPVPIHHPAVAYAADRWWLTGGYPGPTFTASDLFASWAPDEAAWTVHERMPIARGAHGAATVGDEIILVGGVTSGGTVLARADAYNTTTGEWRRLADAPTVREHLAVDAIGHHVYVAGGRAGAFDSDITDLDVYDARNDSWSQGHEMPTPRGGSGGTGSPHGFIVAGGEASGKTFEEVERYDPETGAWETLPPDPDPRHGLCIAALGDRVHVVTGGHEAGFAVSDTHNVLVAQRITTNSGQGHDE